jgi:hypothetical protein
MTQEPKKYCTPGAGPESILDNVKPATPMDAEEGTTDEAAGGVESICETNPSSIGCKVLGEQFIYHIQGLIKDIEEVKPAGYILAIGKLKGAIIKLQAGD